MQFSSKYDFKVIIYDRRGFIRLTTVDFPEITIVRVQILNDHVIHRLPFCTLQSSW